MALKTALGLGISFNLSDSSDAEDEKSAKLPSKEEKTLKKTPFAKTKADKDGEEKLVNPKSTLKLTKQKPSRLEPNFKTNKKTINPPKSTSKETLADKPKSKVHTKKKSQSESPLKLDGKLSTVQNKLSTFGIDLNISDNSDLENRKTELCENTKPQRKKRNNRPRKCPEGSILKDTNMKSLEAASNLVIESKRNEHVKELNLDSKKSVDDRLKYSISSVVFEDMSIVKSARFSPTMSEIRWMTPMSKALEELPIPVCESTRFDMLETNSFCDDDNVLSKVDSKGFSKDIRNGPNKGSNLKEISTDLKLLTNKDQTAKETQFKCQKTCQGVESKAMDSLDDTNSVSSAVIDYNNVKQSLHSADNGLFQTCLTNTLVLETDSESEYETGSEKKQKQSCTTNCERETTESKHFQTCPVDFVSETSSDSASESEDKPHGIVSSTTRKSVALNVQGDQNLASQFSKSENTASSHSEMNSENTASSHSEMNSSEKDSTQSDSYYEVVDASAQTETMPTSDHSKSPMPAENSYLSKPGTPCSNDSKNTSSQQNDSYYDAVDVSAQTESYKCCQNIDSEYEKADSSNKTKMSNDQGTKSKRIVLPEFMSKSSSGVAENQYYTSNQPCLETNWDNDETCNKKNEQNSSAKKAIVREKCEFSHYKQESSFPSSEDSFHSLNQQQPHQDAGTGIAAVNDDNIRDIKQRERAYQDDSSDSDNDFEACKSEVFYTLVYSCSLWYIIFKHF